MRLSKFIQRLQDMQNNIRKSGAEELDPHVVVKNSNDFTDAELEPAGMEIIFLQMHGKSKDGNKGPFVFAHPDQGEQAIQIV